MIFEDARTFDSNSITKYFQDQYNNISVSESEYFTDNFFPANNNSLLALDSLGLPIDQEAYDKYKSQIKDYDTIWRRAGEIFSEHKVFIGKIEMDDIKQGSLGNCYFLSALGALTQYPKLVANLFRNCNINNGYFEIILFIDGQWQIVIVDDYFPISNETGKLIFCKPNMNEIWTILLEKAWAKVNGGYLNTIGGLCGEVLQVLTGAPYLGVTNTFVSNNKLWSMFYDAYKNNYVIGTGSIRHPFIENLGLVQEHAYSVLQLEDIMLNGVHHRLIKLRNPWGKTEWNGAWGDNSPLWNEELKAKLNLKMEDDGAFWMSFDEYVRFYDQADIAYLQFDSINYGHVIEDLDVLKHPIVYKLRIPTKAKVTISVISKILRFNRHTKKEKKGFTVMIASFTDLGLNLITGSYSTKDALSFFTELDKGEYSIFVYGAGSINPLLGQLSVKFSLSSKGSLEFLGFDNNFELLRSLTYKKIEEENKQLFEDEEYYCDQIPGFMDKYGVLPVFLKNNRRKPCKIRLNFYMIFGVIITPIQEKIYGKSEDIEITLGPYEGYVILMVAGELLLSTPTIGLSKDYFLLPNGTLLDTPVSKGIFSSNVGHHFSYYINSLSFLQESESFSYTGQATLDEFYSILNFRVDYYYALKSFTPSSIHNEEDLLWNKFLLDGDQFYIGQVNKDGRYHGIGLLKEGWDVYVGYFVDGIKEIRGKIYWDTDIGSQISFRIECEFKNNLMNGLGKEKDGFYGKFVNGKKIEGLNYITENILWKGKMKNDKKHGLGILLYRSENIAFEFEYDWDDPMIEIPYYNVDEARNLFKEVEHDPNDFIWDC